MAFLRQGDARPFLQHAALHAFKDVTVTDLDRLVKLKGVVVPAPQDRVQKAATLVFRCCPDMGLAQVFGGLGANLRRPVQMTPADMDLDALEEVLDEADINGAKVCALVCRLTRCVWLCLSVHQGTWLDLQWTHCAQSRSPIVRDVW